MMTKCKRKISKVLKKVQIGEQESLEIVERYIIICKKEDFNTKMIS